MEVIIGRGNDIQPSLPRAGYFSPFIFRGGDVQIFPLKPHQPSSSGYILPANGPGYYVPFPAVIQDEQKISPQV